MNFNIILTITLSGPTTSLTMANLLLSSSLFVPTFTLNLQIL